MEGALEAWESERWLNVNIPHIIVDRTSGHCLAANPAAAAMWGLDVAQLTKRSFKDLFDPVSQKVFEAWARDRDRAVLYHPVAPQTSDRTKASLSESWMLQATCLDNGQACLCRVEASKEEDPESEIRRLNWALEAYARSLSGLVRATSITDVANRVCNALVEHEDYILAFVAMAGPSPGKLVQAIAHAGEAAGYMDGLALSWDDEKESGQGPTGRAIRSGCPVMMHDSASDPIFANWRDQAAKFGIRSSVTVPFKTRDDETGVITVYSSKVLAFRARKLRIFAQLGDEVAFAISVLRDRERLEVARQDQLQAEVAMRERQAELERVARALSIGEFASSIAHEITQPLAAIKTNMETALRWLQREEINIEAVMAALSRSARDVDRAVMVVQRTRSFLAKNPPELHDCNINHVIRDVVEFLNAEIERAEIALQLTLEPALPAVLGNEIQLQQVLINLIINARDAMQGQSEQRRLLRISTEMRDEVSLLIRVTDNGVGLAPEVKDRLFDHLVTTKAQGMGMGLAISRSITEFHGGKIWSEPAAPCGTSFCLTLPIAQPARFPC